MLENTILTEDKPKVSDTHTLKKKHSFFLRKEYYTHH